MISPVHATTVARHGPGGWRGVLIAGPSGAGKSDLALRLIGRGWRLVADDYSHVWASGGTLYARAPERLVDRIEARGLGIVTAPCLGLTALALAVDADTTIERMPNRDFRRIAGIDLPLLRLDLLKPSAAEVVALALVALSPGAPLA